MAAPALEGPFILVPLYIYPAPTSWDPLFSSAFSRPNLQFVVIVNPSNGPGAAVPDPNYLTALRRLSSFPNVRILGYLYCSYGERPFLHLQSEIETYKRWSVQVSIHFR